MRLEARNSKFENRNSIIIQLPARRTLPRIGIGGVRSEDESICRLSESNSKLEGRNSKIANVPSLIAHRQSSIQNQHSAIVYPKSTIDSFPPLKTDPRTHTPPHRLSVVPGEIMKQFADLRNSKFENRNSIITQLPARRTLPRIGIGGVRTEDESICRL